MVQTNQHQNQEVGPAIGTNGLMETNGALLPTNYELKFTKLDVLKQESMTDRNGWAQKAIKETASR